MTSQRVGAIDTLTSQPLLGGVAAAAEQLCERLAEAQAPACGERADRGVDRRIDARAKERGVALAVGDVRAATRAARGRGVHGSAALSELAPVGVGEDRATSTERAA